MGQANSREAATATIYESDSRKVFIRFKEWKRIAETFTTPVQFKYELSFQRYRWYIVKRFHEVIWLDSALVREFPAAMATITRPPKYSTFWSPDNKFYDIRAQRIGVYLQQVCDQDLIFQSPKLREFLEISDASFKPELGRKSLKEGYLKKSSGGYTEKFSRKAGDYFTHWRWRYVVMHDTHIAWYKRSDAKKFHGSIQVDRDFNFVVVGRLIIITSATRRVRFHAPTIRDANYWMENLTEFYANTMRCRPQPFQSCSPVRLNIAVRAYTFPRDYMASVAYAMLEAQKEIFICSWKNSPTVMVTRPPLPPLRLDQILRYKAEQGVKIYILLYKEVEFAGQGNDSQKAKAFLEGLSTNIHVLRHPNKLMGGATAVLWSHHEKLVIVDRNLAFVGGIDLAFNRWDDETKSLVDEDGVKYTGKDYRQPAEGLYKPCRLSAAGTGTVSNAHIEVSLAGDMDSVLLPRANINVTAASATVMMDSEVTTLDPNPSVVDFGIMPLDRRSLSGRAAVGADAESQSEVSYNPEATEEYSHAPRGSNESEATTRFRREEMRERNAPMSIDEAQALNYFDEDFVPQSDGTTTTVDLTAVHIEVIEEEGNKGNAECNGVGGLASIRNYMTGYVSDVTSTLYNIAARGGTNPENVKLEVRETHPRMPWHDLHAAVTGAVARDVSMHFVQRWNHHRLALSAYDAPMLVDVTDDVFFGTCARCCASNMSEYFTNCPNCNYELGPVSEYIQPSKPDLLPEHPSSYCFITFECQFRGSLNCSFQGDCPIVVTQLRPPAREEDMITDGILIESEGAKCPILMAQGLIPAVGDVFVAVDGIPVTQLSFPQLNRLISRRRIASYGQPLVVRFRRHFVDEEQASFVDDEKAAIRDLDDKGAVHQPTEALMKSSEDEKKEEENFVDGDGIALRDSLPASSAPPMEQHPEEVITSTPPPVVASEVEEDGKTNVKSAPSKLEADVAEAVANSKTWMVDLASKTLEPAKGLLLAASDLLKGEDEKCYDPICLLSASREVALSISKLFHEKHPIIDVPSRVNAHGTCRVQMLRSVGPWSAGQRKEHSIMSAWCETIFHSERFIYIENQFFIGNLAGPEAQNTVAAAILERIVRAARNKESYRAIIVIPQHPNGDPIHSNRPRIILHYEMQTIYKGAQSLFGQFRKLCPGVDPSEYIEFFCLRNWGVMNNQVVSSQIYVHDKLLIADDRVVILGSANINDRSMLGERDSEMAIRIDDTTTMEILLNKSSFLVGFFPHMLRVQLMRQHVGNLEADVMDILSLEAYQTQWRSVAMANASVYDMLDGETSPYRCKTLNAYFAAKRHHSNKSIHDPIVQAATAEIRGHLITWPLQFLSEENCAPSGGMRVIPTDLWV